MITKPKIRDSSELVRVSVRPCPRAMSPPPLCSPTGNKMRRFGTKTEKYESWTPHHQQLAPNKTVRPYHFPSRDLPLRRPRPDAGGRGAIQKRGLAKMV